MNNLNLLRRVGNPMLLTEEDELCTADGQPLRCMRAYRTEELRLAPRGWLEGKPVYSDSVLYRKKTRDYLPAGEMASVELALAIGNYLAWEGPKVLKRVSVYVDGDLQHEAMYSPGQNVSVVVE